MLSTLKNKASNEKQSCDFNRKSVESKSAFASQQNKFNTSPFDFSQIPLQAKLKINTPGDRYEQEADRITDRVVNMSEVSGIENGANSDIQRKSLLHKKNLGACHHLMTFGKSKTSVQPKLTVNRPGDIYEQEADAMADKVMSMSTNETVKPVTGLIGRSLQRKCTHCEEEVKKKPIVRKAENNNAVIPVSFASSLNASKGGGAPLPQGTRIFMENAFNADFSKVKIHTDSQAAEMSRGINAKAFTYGKDIYFSEGWYDPHSGQGRHLLAHELTHIIQQKDPKFFSNETLHRQPDYRKIPDLSDQVEEDSNLYYTGSGQKKRIVDHYYLAHLAYTKGAETLEAEILGSHGFIGKDSVRKAWANFLREHLDGLLMYEGFRLDELQKQQEDENNKRKLEEHKARPAKKINFRFSGSFAIAEYQPAQSLLLITVPIQFDFLSSQYTHSVPVGDLSGSKPVTMVERTETLSWDGTEQADWKRSFISLVESSWSTTKTNHIIFSTEPTLKDLRVKVRIGIKEFKSGNTIPADINLFKAKIYRDEIPITACRGRPACVARQAIILPYNSISDSAGRTAIHEFGHVLGLGDEYFDSDTPNEKTATHSSSVQSEFGYGVSRIDSEKTDRFKSSIMGSGGVVLIEHGVGFLAAMKQITKSSSWTLKSP